MRFKNFAASVLFALSLSLAGSFPANAQSFLGTLFGFSKPAPQYTPVPKSRSKPSGNRYVAPRERSYLYETDPYRRKFDRQRWQSQSRFTGSYKTVCVRTCDGYFFPISSGTTRSRFHNDARECKRRCGTQTALFYMSRYEDDIRAAHNLAGGSYEDLENAFKYRKSLVNGCACRPMPWSAAERARHNRYKVLATVKKSYAISEARARQRHEVDVLVRKVHAAKTDAAQAIAFVNPFPKESKVIAGAKFAALGRPAGTFYRTQTINLEVYDHETWLAASRAYASPFQQTIHTQNLDRYAEAGQSFEPVSSYPANVSSGVRLADDHKRTNTIHRRKRALTKRKKQKSAFSNLFAQQKNTHRWPGD